MTILAFIYVPLNLATSIFGMNIQQLNQSGQHIRVFVLTALIALLLTFFVWFGMAQLTAYVQWRDQYNAYDRYDSWPKRGKNYHFIIRVVILYMLLRRGHFSWTWISGAWIRILTNERAGFFSDFANSTSERVQEFCYRGTACDYVCSNIKGWGKTGFNPDHFKRRSTR